MVVECKQTMFEHRAFPFFRILPMFGISARVCLQVWFTREQVLPCTLDTEELLRAPLTFTTCDYQHNHLKPRMDYSFFAERRSITKIRINTVILRRLVIRNANMRYRYWYVF